MIFAQITTGVYIKDPSFTQTPAGVLLFGEGKPIGAVQIGHSKYGFSPKIVLEQAVPAVHLLPEMDSATHWRSDTARREIERQVVQSLVRGGWREQ